MADSKFRDSLRDFLTQYPIWTAVDQFLDTKWGKRFLAFLGGAIVSGVGLVASFFTALSAGWKYGLFGAFIAFLLGALLIYLTKETSIVQAEAKPASLETPQEPQLPVTIRFENREPFVVVTPTVVREINTGVDIGPGYNRVYVRLFPECTEPIEQCLGYLMEISRKVGDAWQRTVFNEPWPLTWANYGTLPITIRPALGPFLDIFYIAENEVRIAPCIRHDGAPLRMLNPEPELFRSREQEFRFKVQIMQYQPISEPIFLKVQIGTQWDRPIVTVLANENSN